MQNITRCRMQQTSLSTRQGDPIRRSILTWRDSAQSTTFSFQFDNNCFSFYFKLHYIFFQKQFQIDKITLHTAGRFDTRRLIQFSSLQKMVEIFGFILFKSRDGHRPLRHTVHHCDKKLWNFVVGTRESEHCCLLLSVAPQHSKFLTGWHRLLGPWLCW